MSSVYEIPVERIDGAPATLGEFAGKVLLVVNVASKCGFTPQYAGLEKLYEAQRERGLVLAGFPANNFGAQEPGSNGEIATFCSATYGVEFPMFGKISVKGPDRHPLYRELTAAQPVAIEPSGSQLRAKLTARAPRKTTRLTCSGISKSFSIGRNGEVVARFSPDVAPDDPVLLEAIERELAKPA